MKYKQKFKLIKEILKDSPYEIQKKKIRDLFKKTKNNKSDILLRLYVIDSCYSTNMNRRFFGFEELSDLILKLSVNIKKNIDVNKFIEKNFELAMKPIGIDKKGNFKGHAFSLLTKYIYFVTDFKFPIYDRFVYDGLIIDGVKLPKIHRPNIKYFNELVNLANKLKVSFDDLDKYFWVCGKIREGNLSLLIKDKNYYKNHFLNKLKLTKKEKKLKSREFDKIISKKLSSEKNYFNDSKLQKIQKLARMIKKD